jgi:hypothetical protein
VAVLGSGAALASPAFAPDRLQRAPRTQVVVPGGRGPEPPGANGYEPPPQDATPRSAFRFALENAPSMSEAGNGSSVASNCSQAKSSFCRRQPKLFLPSPRGAKRSGRGCRAAKAARRVRGGREQQSQSSLPGVARRKTRVNALMTRQSILFREKSFTKRMDPRVKPAGDGMMASRKAAPHPALAIARRRRA